MQHLGRTRLAPLPLAVAPTLPTGAAGRGEYAIFYRRTAARPLAALAARPPDYADAYIYAWHLPVVN